MMKSYKNNTNVSDENTVFSLAAVSVLGDREEQQDCFGYALQADEGLIAVCDGMGGHAGGQKASNTAIHVLLNAFEHAFPVNDPEVFLIEQTCFIDREIESFRDVNGKALQAGSTLVSVFIRKNLMYWMSVGDSRLYLFRKDELIQVTQDHNYKTVLDEQLSSGAISQASYERDKKRGDGLISFLGIGNVRLLDNNSVPFRLVQNDMLLLASDGLYKNVPDHEIQEILGNFTNISEAVHALDMKANKNAKKYGAKRDNMTAVLIRMK